MTASSGRGKRNLGEDGLRILTGEERKKEREKDRRSRRRVPADEARRMRESLQLRCVAVNMWTPV